jgi:IS30 family transposase
LWLTDHPARSPAVRGGRRTNTKPTIRKLKSCSQQGEILALLLGDPDLELSLTEIAARLGVPHPSVYREIQRAKHAGLVTSCAPVP